MAYSIDGTDIVINGWENGISDNPTKGINEMRGVNIISVPGEVSVSFDQTSKVLPTVQATIDSVNTTDDTITATVTVGSLTKGQAIQFAGTPPAPLNLTDFYWVGAVSGSTFKVFPTPEIDTPVNLTSYTGPSTMGATVSMGEIRYFEKTTGVALDVNGRAWYTGGLANHTSYVYMGNPVSGTVGLSNTIGNGLIWYKEYLFLFYNSRICYIHIANSNNWYIGASWVNEWDPTTGAVGIGVSVFNTPTGTGNIHEAIIGINDDTIYITDAGYIASLFENPGSTFNPATPATYSWAKQAIASPLPANDIAISLAELGKNLMIGGQKNAVYPWNRIDSGPNNALLVAENNIVHMITVNTNTYIFAGNRGRIYFTNGSQAQLYTKIPDHISGQPEPIFTWKNCAYNKNQIYFGISATNNAGSAITAYNGLWAVDITTNSTRVPAVQSTNPATVSAVHASSSNTGYGLAVGWTTGSTHGIDVSASTPYTSYSSYIITDLLPIGLFLTKRTLTNIEFKLSCPLASGEGVKISGRTSLTGNWATGLIGETTTAGTIADTYILPFDQMQWLQLKVEMKSTANNPSFVRLYELRLR